jgi:hypothetical protein
MNKKYAIFTIGELQDLELAISCYMDHLEEQQAPIFGIFGTYHPKDIQDKIENLERLLSKIETLLLNYAKDEKTSHRKN